MKQFSASCVLAAAVLFQLSFAAPLNDREVDEEGDACGMGSVAYTVTPDYDTTTAIQASKHYNHFHHHTSASSSDGVVGTTPSSSSPTLEATSDLIPSSSSSYDVVTPTASVVEIESMSSTPYIASSSPSSSEVIASSTSASTSSYIAASPTSTPVESSSSAQKTESSSKASSASSGTEVSSTASGLTPAGTKAGLSGYVGVQNKAGFTALTEYISWYSDYSPTTPDVDTVQGIPMLWGDSSSCDGLEITRVTDYKSSVSTATPKIMFGFYEPDCDCPMSSNISDAALGTVAWNTLIAPLAALGTTLGSPSMCKQKDEDWLTPFSVDSATNATLLDAEWDVTSIHINKNTLAGVQADVEYYASTYGKPIWVSEFACVDDQDEFVACSDQTEIDDFINQVVPYLQANENVVAYGPSNGEGLGTVWPLFDSDTGELSATGTTYLNALKAL